MTRTKDWLATPIAWVKPDEWKKKSHTSLLECWVELNLRLGEPGFNLRFVARSKSGDLCSYFQNLENFGDQQPKYTK